MWVINPRRLRPCPLYTPPVAPTDRTVRRGLETAGPPRGRKATGPPLELVRTLSFRGRRSRNKVSVGEPAEGSVAKRADRGRRRRERLTPIPTETPLGNHKKRRKRRQRIPIIYYIIHIHIHSLDARTLARREGNGCRKRPSDRAEGTVGNRSVGADAA